MSRPPLPAESRYWSRTDLRQGTVTGLFDRAARHYDRACAIMTLGTGRQYRREALVRAGLRPGMHVLDVGIGTGLLAREIASVIGPSGRLFGLDPSRNMIAAARTRLDVNLVQGVGDSLPFGDGRFDFVAMGYALRHVSDLDCTFDEYRRVLKDGGRVLLLEITRPASSVGLALARAYFGTVVPAMTRVATGSGNAAELMRFYWETIAACVSPEVVLASLRRCGFHAAERAVAFGILSEYTATRA